MRHVITFLTSLLLLLCAAYLSWPVTADVSAFPPMYRPAPLTQPAVPVADENADGAAYEVRKPAPFAI